MIRALLLTAAVLAAAPGLAQPSQQEMKDACLADYRRFCAGTVPGDGRILKCMKAHRSEIDAGCRDLIDKYAPD